MGLEMYLQARRYCYDGTHLKDPEAAILIEAADKLDFPKEREHGYSLTVDIGYWRKANAIHQWFIDHCAEGVDDCRPVYVAREQVQELRDLCAELAESKDEERAKEELSTANGFFFGSTEYDQYYWDDLAETVTILDRALALDPSHFDVIYRASW